MIAWYRFQTQVKPKKAITQNQILPKMKLFCEIGPQKGNKLSPMQEPTRNIIPLAKLPSYI
jgi:hypothetical protein